MLVGGGGGTNKVNGTPTKKVTFVTNGDEDDGNDDFDIDFEDDDNELSVDGGGLGIGGHEVTPEVSERAERLERAKQNPNVSVLRDFLRIGRLVVELDLAPLNTLTYFVEFI